MDGPWRHRRRCCVLIGEGSSFVRSRGSSSLVGVDKARKDYPAEVYSRIDTKSVDLSRTNRYIYREW